jgi:flagellum-specific peptidoglycan hydrolase FlgJ
MKRLIFFTLSLSFLCLQLSAENHMARQDRLDYIDSYRDIAIAEMNRFGIPASIKLAQAILESNAGQSTLARKAKNHFGIKCGKYWDGETFYKEDDDYDHRGKIIASCFRKYGHARESFTAHSEFLADPQKGHRYAFLFDYGSTDYERWAYGLKRAGYATNPEYPKLLIRIIQEYELYHFDNSPLPNYAMNRKIVRINQIKSVRSGQNENLYSIAHHYNTSVNKLMDYNEVYQNPRATLKPHSIVYLEKKKNRYYGKQSFHIVRKGDSMFTISQKYGIKLPKLLALNRMSNGEEPAFGSKVAISRKVSASSKPMLRENEIEQIEIIPADQAIAGSSELKEVERSKSSKENTSEKNRTTRASRTENGKYLDFDVEVETYKSREEDYIVMNDRPSSAEGEIVEVGTIQEIGLDKKVHIVSQGDTLYSLARAYEISVKEIKSLNDLSTNQIAIGQSLIIQ